MLAEAERLDLDSPVERYLPELGERAIGVGEARGRITVRNLLTHTSGLPAHRDYLQKTLDRGADRPCWRLAEPLVYEPGTQSVYSDLGFHFAGRDD